MSPPRQSSLSAAIGSIAGPRTRSRLARIGSTSLEMSARPSAYYPHAQQARGGMTLVVRVEGDVAASAGALGALVRAIRGTMRGLDPSLPLGNVAPLDAELANRGARRRPGRRSGSVVRRGASPPLAPFRGRDARPVHLHGRPGRDPRRRHGRQPVAGAPRLLDASVDGVTERVTGMRGEAGHSRT